MRRLRALVAVTTLAVAVLAGMAVPAAVADGTDCSWKTTRATISLTEGWWGEVDLEQLSVWRNCGTHTHPQEITMKFQFRSDDAERDWRGDADDYVSYTCTSRTNKRVADRWSGTLRHGDRVDGHVVTDQSRMLYKYDPRTVCTGQVHLDQANDWKYKAVGGALSNRSRGKDDYAEADYAKVGTRVSGPDGACGDGRNVSNTHVKVCFKEYGDKLYVRDSESDGRSAYGEFDEVYTVFNGGDYKACRNPYGAGTWVVCDYAVAENSRVKFFGYTRDNEGAFNNLNDLTSFRTDWNGG